MIEEYMTINEVAEKWGVTPRRIRVLCTTGRIDGATKFGREWAIPANTEKPEDKRVTTGDYRDWRKKDKKSNKIDIICPSDLL